MKAITSTIFLFLFLTNCKNSKTKITIHKVPVDTVRHTATSNSIADTTENQIDTTLVHLDSARILGKKYIAIYKTNDTLYVLNSKADTILKLPGLYPNFEFDDFNGDGLKDVRISHIGNIPGVEDLLLFDKSKRNFRLVENFSDFPEPNPIEGTRYYYSYHRSGCADMNWDSDLFYIENFKAIRIGNIAGRECNDRDVKDAVYIHTVHNEKEKLFKTLPIKTIWKYKDYKWGFIKEYWTKNYKLFL